MRNHNGTTRWRLGLVAGSLLALASHTWAQTPGAPTEGVPFVGESDEATTSTSPAGESASATTPTAAATRRIPVDSLDVEGTRSESVKRVVLSESRLVAGREYSEQDIALAARRVKRLPFILDARPSLRRGGSPGRYTLVFVVEEHSPLSFGFGGDHWSDGEGSVSSGLGGPSVERFLGSLTQVRFALEAGAARSRSSLNSGEPSVSDTPLSAKAALGLTRYNLVGPASRLDITATGGRDVCSPSSELAGPCQLGLGWGLQSRLLIPLRRDDSLSLTAALRSGREREAVYQDAQASYESRWLIGQLNASWTRDTTDDPVAALEGTRVVASVGLWTERWKYKDWPYDWPPIFNNSSGAVLALRLQHLRPIGRGFTLSATANPLGAATGDSSSTFAQAGLGLRWVHAERRDRYRLSLESGLVGAVGGSEGSRHWIPYSALRLRSGVVVIALDARWAR